MFTVNLEVQFLAWLLKKKLAPEDFWTGYLHGDDLKFARVLTIEITF